MPWLQNKWWTSYTIVGYSLIQDISYEHGCNAGVAGDARRNLLIKLQRLMIICDNIFSLFRVRYESSNPTVVVTVPNFPTVLPLFFTWTCNTCLPLF